MTNYIINFSTTSSLTELQEHTQIPFKTNHPKHTSNVQCVFLEWKAPKFKRCPTEIKPLEEQERNYLYRKIKFARQFCFSAFEMLQDDRPCETVDRLGKKISFEKAFWFRIETFKSFGSYAHKSL